MSGNDPNQLLRTAIQALRESRLEDAVAAYEPFLRLKPSHADSWFNLGYCYRHLGRFDVALESYRKALDHGISGPAEVHVNRAVILSEHLERVDEAEAALQAALAHDPFYVVALLNLGNLREDRGDVNGAREAYERATAASPNEPRAIARLATLDVMSGEATAVVGRLETLLASPLPPEGAAEIGFALGHALDAAGRYDDAFAAFAAANRNSRLAEPLAPYDRAAQERLVDSLIATFPLARPNKPGPGKAPLFICGMFRSGSTLAEQILAAHPDVTAGGELEFLPTIVATSLQPYPQAVLAADEEALAAFRARYVSALRARFPDPRAITDKRPDNFLHVGLIKALFPEARIIHTFRKPLDNILSIYFLHFQATIGYATDVEDAAHWYRQYRRLMRHWQSVFAEDIFDLDYDALVADPEPHVRRLLDFCGLAWNPACLTPHSTARVVRTASVWQVRQPLHQRSSGRATHYAAHLTAARQILDDA